jgi:hypothetical protein
MKVVTYKGIKSMDENVLAVYLFYKEAYKNGIITKRSSRHVFESGRTPCNYQAINRHIKLLKKHGLIEEYLGGWRLISKKELALVTDGKDNVLFTKIHTEKKTIKEIKAFLALSQIGTKLNQIEFRKLTKSKRPSKSLRKFIKKSLQKNHGAFTQVSYTTLSKFLRVSRDTARRRVKYLYTHGYMSVIGSYRKVVRRLSKLEEPTLQSGEFVYKGWVYHVTSPEFRVNSEQIREKILAETTNT